MKRSIDVSSEILQEEGLCYDLDRARQEGLYEEMKLVTVPRSKGSDRYEIRLTHELFDALLDATDLAVNIGPDEEQTVRLEVVYQYSYGRVE